MSITMTLRSIRAGNDDRASEKQAEPRRRSLRLCCLAALAAGLWLAAAGLYRETRPVYGPVTLLLPGEAPRPFTSPFRWQKAPKTKFILVQQLWLPRHHPTTFTFYPKDFLWSVSVNGNPVRAQGLPLSAASYEGGSIDLAPGLHPGRNEITLQMEVKWEDARLQLSVSPWDNYRLLLLAIVLAATCATAAFLATLFHARISWPEAAILLAGAGLRELYLFGAPYFVRSFDYWGHEQYIDFVARNFSLPAPNANWEAFQPPLYYILTGAGTRIMLALGMAEDQRYVLWQLLSIVISIGALLAGYAIVSQLYTSTDRSRLYLPAILAVAPPLVFNAARVSNDGLLTLLAFTWLALLLRYWRKPEGASWVGLSLVLGLALLTKANALVLVTISALCLTLDFRLNAKSKISRLATLLAICAAISGWYYLGRAHHSNELDTYVVGNLHSLNYRAHIDHVFLKSLIFNPFKVIRYPFAETWGPRNDYFLEIFFKTMLLGEWIKGLFYKPLARFMIVVALCLIPPFIIGLYKAVTQRKAEEWPLLLTLGGVFIAQWIFLQLAPYLSTQDFRFSVLLLVPLAWLFLRGTESLPYHIKNCATFLLQVALLNSAIYLIVLSLGR
jgi:hypothetical protein